MQEQERKPSYITEVLLNQHFPVELRELLEEEVSEAPCPVSNLFHLWILGNNPYVWKQVEYDFGGMLGS